MKMKWRNEIIGARNGENDCEESINDVIIGGVSLRK
jgi:hypothetical protein